MQEIEKCVKQSSVEIEIPPPERVDQQYRQWCEVLFGKAVSLSQRKVVTYAEQLRVYHVSLTVNEQTRTKDALAYLEKYFKNLQEGKYVIKLKLSQFHFGILAISGKVVIVNSRYWNRKEMWGSSSTNNLLLLASTWQNIQCRFII